MSKLLISIVLTVPIQPNIEDYFIFKHMTFELPSIIYFQGLHYTLHVNNMQNVSWEKGFLFENCPNFQID